MASCTQDQRRPDDHHRHLPNDVLIDILTRLPVKSLLRSKCVCKNWHDLIQNPTFAHAHFRFQKLQDKGRIFLQYFNDIDAPSKYHYALFPDETLASDAYHDLDVLEIYSAAVIDGPVNGLFCVFNYEDRFIIWNPAIREFRTLPFPGRPELPPNLDIVYSNTGFGFDKSNDDYKVVLIRCSDYRVKDMPMVNDVCVHVYSLSTNTWRRLDGLGYPSPEYLRRCRSEIGAYSDGVYYWWAGGGVVAFDMGNEVFRAISAPFVLLPSEVDECVVRPCNGDGRIALYRFKGFPESAGVLDRCCDIWVMEEEEGSWIKRFSVGPITCGAFQQGFWKNGELLFLRLIQGSHDRCRRRVFQLVLYNPYTRELRYLGPKGDFSDYRALVYHESLVSVNGGMHQTKGRLCDSLTAAQYLFSWPPRIPRFDLCPDMKTYAQDQEPVSRCFSIV